MLILHVYCQEKRQRDIEQDEKLDRITNKALENKKEAQP